MMTVEVFTTHAPADKQALAERLLHGVVTEDDAPESVMAGARALTHVVVHDPVAWATGGDDAPRYLVRLTVPGAWNQGQFGEYVIPKITDVLASFEDDPGRLRREPHCVVQIVGLREGSLGVLGGVTGITEITKLITEGFRTSGEQRQAPEGSVIDPVCGMVVELATTPFTLTHDGQTYGFCAAVCRKVFAEEKAIPV